MALETDTEVENIKTVQDSQGNTQAPANEVEQKKAVAAATNEPGVTADSYTTGGTTAESLPAHAVPDGIAVLVRAMDGNAGDVNLGDSGSQTIPLAPGDAIPLAVQDTSNVYIQTPNSGDGVAMIFES